jgi:hypothetical protein
VTSELEIATAARSFLIIIFLPQEKDETTGRESMYQTGLAHYSASEKICGRLDAAHQA